MSRINAHPADTVVLMPTPPDSPETGEEMKTRRQKLGLTQKRVAEEAGLRPEQVSRAEAGHATGEITYAKIRGVLEHYERRYGMENPDEVVTVLELPDGRRLTFTGAPGVVAEAVNQVKYDPSPKPGKPTS